MLEMAIRLGYLPSPGVVKAIRFHFDHSRVPAEKLCLTSLHRPFLFRTCFPSVVYSIEHFDPLSFSSCAMDSRSDGHVQGVSLFAGLRQAFLRGFWRDEQELKARRKAEEKSSMNPADDTRPRRATCHYDYMIPALLDTAVKNPHLKLLDVGCGSGSITIELAKLIPEGQVTGLDISGAILESAKVHAERQRVSNTTFIKGDVHDLPLPNRSFDVVCTHQAVAHFQDRHKAIKELARVTRKRGVICMREGDLRTGKFSAGYEVLDECFQVIIKVHEEQGGSSDAGRRLKQWAEDAGISSGGVVATQSVWIYDTPEGRKEYGGHWPARCTQGVFADRAVEMGVPRLVHVLPRT